MCPEGGSGSCSTLRCYCVATFVRLRRQRRDVYSCDRVQCIRYLPCKEETKEFAREFVYLIRLRANHRSLASLLLPLLLILRVVEVVRSVPPLYLVSRITPRFFAATKRRRKEIPFRPKKNISRIKINLVLGNVYFIRCFFELNKNRSPFFLVRSFLFILVMLYMIVSENLKNNAFFSWERKI